MKSFKVNEILSNAEIKAEVINAIKQGFIFIYPTDTIYGLGCNALNPDSVNKIRALKHAKHSFSVIAPSLEWIKKNLVVDHPEHLNKLPGPFTFILKKKEPDFLKEASAFDTLGVRIPAHPFTQIIQESGVPFITTSVNISGENPITRINETPKSIWEHVDYVVYDGKLRGTPSTVIDLTTDEKRILR